MVYSNNLGQVRVGVRGWVAQTTTSNTTDADATLFVTAAGITDSTQISALNTLVTDLKTYGLWTKMKAIYPFVGGSAASHKFNLKDPRDLDAAYRLVFNGGWTHTGTGAQPNGTTGYADTKLDENNVMTLGSEHLSIYSKTNIDGLYCDIGLTNDSDMRDSSIFSKYNNIFYPRIHAINNGISNTTNSLGLFISNRVSSTEVRAFQNNVLKQITNQLGIKSNGFIFIGAMNRPTTGTAFYSPRIYSFSSIGDGLSDNDASNFYISVQKFQTTLGRHVGTPYVSDPDAIAFLMAAGITDSTQAAAINTLVIRMKADGVWTKMKAVYPFVGGTAASHKFNLKDPRDLDAAYRLVFNGGGTHTSNGYKGNGSNSYADSKFPANILSPGNAHLSFYNRTTVLGSGYVTAIQDNASWDTNKTVSLGVGNSGNGGVIGGYFAGAGVNSTTTKTTTWTSLTLVTTTSTNLRKVYNSGIVQGSSTTNSTNTFSTSNLVIGAHAGAFNYVGSYETSFVSFGDGLTDTDATNLYSAVQAYQTTLGRQTDVPLVSDTDAQSFLNAANITSFQQASAVNKLVIDLKAAGVWTKMKAIYPFVGGSAASHKFNLKDPRDLDAAYRLVFNGGWTHTGTGALSNGTNAYANTYLTPSTNLSNNNVHDSIYINNNTTSNVYAGFGAMISYTSAFYTHINSNGLYASFIGIEQVSQNGVIYSNNSNQGFYINSRISSTSLKGYKNGILKNSSSFLNTGSLPSNHYYYGVRNMDSSTYNNYSHSFASIGDGMTDTEASAFYTAIQTYQTSLGRLVDTPIYNNGLVLNLDSGNANSYPGTGTTWFDLASVNNGTLVNGPTYDATNGGSLLFDGVNDRVSSFPTKLPDTSSKTIDIWFKSTSSVRQGLCGIRDGVNVTGWVFTINRTSTGNLTYFNTGQGVVEVSAGITTNTWYNAVLTHDYSTGVAKIYLNGKLLGTGNAAGYNSSTFNGVIGDEDGSFVTPFKGNIPKVTMYNRVLTDTEILNNFNSTRGRFGL